MRREGRWGERRWEERRWEERGGGKRGDGKREEVGRERRWEERGGEKEEEVGRNCRKRWFARESVWIKGKTWRFLNRNVGRYVRVEGSADEK